MFWRALTFLFIWFIYWVPLCNRPTAENSCFNFLTKQFLTDRGGTVVCGQPGALDKLLDTACRFYVTMGTDGAVLLSFSRIQNCVDFMDFWVQVACCNVYTPRCCSPPCARHTPDTCQPSAPKNLQTITRAHLVTMAELTYHLRGALNQRF